MRLRGATGESKQLVRSMGRSIVLSAAMQPAQKYDELHADGNEDGEKLR